MIGKAQFDAYIWRSFNAIATSLRKDGSPSSSMVSYAPLDDHIVFSTTLGRLKGRTLTRDPRIALCIVNEREPNSYVTVEGKVIIHADNPRAMQERAFAYWQTFAEAYPQSPWVIYGRAKLEAMWSQPGRAMFEVIPTRVSGYLL